MAWDINLRLANNVDISVDGAGSWVKVDDVPSSSFTPNSNTMLIGDWGRMGLAEFRLWIHGVDLTTATRVDLVIDIEEADDDSGTNVQPVCRFRLGTGAVTATPSGYAYTKAADSTTDAQFAAVGIVTKRYLRYYADVTLTGGGSVIFQGVTIMVRGLADDVERLPANVDQ